MAKRSSKSKKPETVLEEESEGLPYDPFRGSETVTLQELLEDVFSDNLEEGASFLGPNALTVNSEIWADEDRPLHKVARRGNDRCIRLLLGAGADPNAKGDLGFSPLHEAVGKGHLEIARLLLEAGADCALLMGPSRIPKCSASCNPTGPASCRTTRSHRNPETG